MLSPRDSWIPPAPWEGASQGCSHSLLPSLGICPGRVQKEELNPKISLPSWSGGTYWAGGECCGFCLMERLGSIQIVFIDFFFEAVVSAFAGVGIPGGLLHCYRAALWLGGMVRQAGSQLACPVCCRRGHLFLVLCKPELFLPQCPTSPSSHCGGRGMPRGSVT